MENKPTPKKTGFFEIIKNLFWLLLVLQFAPVVFLNLKKLLSDAVEPKTHIGYLTINDMITDSSFYVKHIRNFLKSSDIKGLLLTINSPGGLPGSAQAIYSELNKFKEKKPIVSFIENIGTSAAYNIAIASNHIVASPSSLVGNIGVWMQIPPNIKYLAEDWKIKFRTIKSGNFKTAGSPFDDMTPEEQAHLQGVSDDSYNQFIKNVSDSRHLSLDEHKTWANGKVFTGNQALTFKLIDQLGSEQDAIDQLKKIALIEEDVKLIKPKRPSRFMQLFTAEDGNDQPYSSMAANFISNVALQVMGKFRTI